ncbi:MAG: hypothetical protein PHH80_05740, partial [Sphaerochaetaceae bacterium]|nr:hypothetical protein [Sphaerochaetaceae bacterium]
QGTSYLPYLHREKDPSTWKDVVFAQISEDKVSRTIRTKRWKYAITAKDVDGFSVAGSDCYEEEFLYDLQADPFELENLNNSKAHEAVRARLRKLILIKMHEAGEKIPNIIGAVNEDEVRGQRLVFKEELDAITALY